MAGGSAATRQLSDVGLSAAGLSLDLAELPSVALADRADGEVSDLLLVMRERVDELYGVIGAAHGSALRRAAAVVDAFERLESMAVALAAEATVVVDRQAHCLLVEEGAAPGAPRLHATDATNAEASRDSFVRRDQLAGTTLGAVLGVSRTTAAKRLTAARRLVGLMPNTRQRLLDGDWTGFHLKLVLDAARYATDDAVAGVDEAHCAMPERIAPTRLTQRVLGWLADHGHATTANDRRAEGFAGRRVKFGKPDVFGMRRMHGYLSADDATAIETCLAQIASSGELDDTRTWDQRVADSFVALFTGPAALSRSLAGELGCADYNPVGERTTALGSPVDSGDPWTRETDDFQRLVAQSTWQTILMLASTLGLSFPDPAKATLKVHVSLPTLLGLQAAASQDSNGPPVGDRRGSSIDGLGLVHDDLVRRLARHAFWVQRVVTDPLTGQVIEIGKVRDTIPGAMVTRAKLRDETCRFPGCTRPSSAEVDIDHIIATSDGGVTTDTNLQCLCREHHRIKHQTDWMPLMNPDGSITWHSDILDITRTD